MATGRIPINGTAAIQSTIVDAKGDLIAGTGADAVSRLAVGTDGHTLVADSSTSTGLAWAAPASTGALTLVKTQTIGSAVSTVTVTNAFSSSYDNYVIMISGGVGSTSENLNLQLGSTTTGYYVAGFYNYANSASLVGDSYNNTSSFKIAGSVSTNSLNGIIHLQGPNLAKFTNAHYQNHRTATADSIAMRATAFEASTTQHTDFTLAVGSGTITGGTIKVYGYANS